MVKEIAIGKRAKISEAQQYMFLSVLGASIVLGISISLISHFIKLISFQTKVIMEEEKAVVAYSNVIKNTGVCKSPSGSIYSDTELEKCKPEEIEISEIPGTLRANILTDIAANAALGSVPNETNPNCINPDTNESYTYKELNKIYTDSKGASELQSASQLIKSCSALRVIPDALPAFKNEEALLASLNKLFNISGWHPEQISPSGDTSASSLGNGLNTISVNLSVEADTGTTMNVLNNIERSIREFNVERATIEWSGDSSLTLQAQATAYYMDESKIIETTKTIKSEDNKK